MDNIVYTFFMKTDSTNFYENLFNEANGEDL